MSINTIVYKEVTPVTLKIGFGDIIVLRIHTIQLINQELISLFCIVTISEAQVGTT